MDLMKAMLIEGPLYGRALQGGVQICHNPKSANSLLTNDEKNALKNIFFQLGNKGYKLDREEILRNMHQMITLGRFPSVHKQNIDTVSNIIKEVNRTLYLSSKHDILNRENGPVNGRKEHRSDNFFSVKQNGVGFQDDSKYDSDDENTGVIKIDNKSQGINNKISAPPRLQQTNETVPEKTTLDTKNPKGTVLNKTGTIRINTKESNLVSNNQKKLPVEKRSLNSPVPTLQQSVSKINNNNNDFAVIDEGSRTNDCFIDEYRTFDGDFSHMFQPKIGRSRKNSDSSDSSNESLFGLRTEPEQNSNVVEIGKTNPGVHQSNNSLSSNESLYDSVEEMYDDPFDNKTTGGLTDEKTTDKGKKEKTTEKVQEKKPISSMLDAYETKGGSPRSNVNPNNAPPRNEPQVERMQQTEQQNQPVPAPNDNGDRSQPSNGQVGLLTIDLDNIRTRGRSNGQITRQFR